MSSPVTVETHKQYQPYKVSEVVRLYTYIQHLRNIVMEGGNAPYNGSMFLNHAKANKESLKELIDTALLNEHVDIEVPANIIFWLYRGSVATGEVCPIELPHICKLPSDNGETFHVTSRLDWLAHRAACHNQPPISTIPDHTKIQYLTRVLGMDMNVLLKDFPYQELKQSEGVLLEDGRYEHTIGDYIYVTADNVCITILRKGMVTR